MKRTLVAAPIFAICTAAAAGQETPRAYVGARIIPIVGRSQRADSRGRRVGGDGGAAGGGANRHSGQGHHAGVDLHAQPYRSAVGW